SVPVLPTIYTLSLRDALPISQADGRFRGSVEDIARLRVRNGNGEMVPIGAMVDVRQSFGPDPVLRYNGYPAADIAGESDPRVLRSEEHTSELQSRENLVCRLL